jgi:hypothetical protein
MTATLTRDLVKLALAPSPTEQEKAARTHTAIRKHLETDGALRKYSIDTYLQGSYKNSTNVRGDSDVDMGSVTPETFYHNATELPDETPAYLGHGSPQKSLRESVLESFSKSDFTYWDYRNDVLASLTREYGSDSVVDGNKAITIEGNNYRLDADVLPCTTFRWYYKTYQGGASYHTGISFFTKASHRVVNFPHQHFENLKDKDQSNDGKVKGCVRVFKRVRNELDESGQWDRKRSPSYYLEGLVWNVPDEHFDGAYDQVVPRVLQYLWKDLTQKKDEGGDALRSYMQANNIFVLFHPTFWNADDAIAFIEAIWGAIHR